jgi:hypothetical protein
MKKTYHVPFGKGTAAECLMGVLGKNAWWDDGPKEAARIKKSEA